VATAEVELKLLGNARGQTANWERAFEARKFFFIAQGTRKELKLK
jgi:hypothetical protein